MTTLVMLVTWVVMGAVGVGLALFVLATTADPDPTR
jgi:hypothetical protein